MLHALLKMFLKEDHGILLTIEKNPVVTIINVNINVETTS